MEWGARDGRRRSLLRYARRSVQIVNAKTGEVLSKFKIGSGVVGNPITYMGPDGKQYVAVYAGIGGDVALFANDTSADTTDVRPAADFMPNLARHTSHGGIVWIFGL